MIATPKGGTHLSGFEQGITKTFNEVLRASKTLKTAEPDVVKEDVLEGLTAVVTVRLAEPQFEGQTKEILGTPAARTIVRKVVASELKKFLTSTKRAEKAQAKLTLEKVANASRTRIAARQHRETQRRKSALESSALRHKLGRLPLNDIDRSELFIVEVTPRSAPPSSRATRSSRRCCRSGARSSTCRRRPSPTCSRTPSAPRSSRSSGRARDAPSTSRHVATAGSSSWPTPTPTGRIRCLLTTLFFKYMPDLITQGRVFTAVPPLHRIELSNPKKGMDKYLYTYSTPTCSGSSPS